jgi:hypothetical protein
VQRHQDTAMNIGVRARALCCMSVIQGGKVQFLEDFLEAECASLHGDGCRIYTRTRQERIRSGVYLLID